MKFVRFSLVAAALAGLGAAIACSTSGTRGSGNVETREFDLQNFSRIRAAVFDVTITRSDTFSVTVSADDNLFEKLDIDVRGDELRLEPKRGVDFRGPITLEATVGLPSLIGVHLSGTAGAHASGFDAPEPIDIEVSGASELNATLNAADIVVEASGASQVTLEGSATALAIEGSGATRFDLARFAVETAEIRLSGATHATVQVSERIESADVSGASSLRYSGDPILGQIETSGASSVLPE